MGREESGVAAVLGMDGEADGRRQRGPARAGHSRHLGRDAPGESLGRGPADVAGEHPGAPVLLVGHQIAPTHLLANRCRPPLERAVELTRRPKPPDAVDFQEQQCGPLAQPKPLLESPLQRPVPQRPAPLGRERSEALGGLGIALLRGRGGLRR